MEDSAAPRRSAPPGRSGFSANWRQKDETPRPDAQPQTRNERSFNQNRGQGAAGTPAPSVPETRLYVGNLLYTAERQDVEAFFTDHGFQLTGISMSIDPFTNRNRSYAFVDFETVEEAQRAMTELTGQELMGRPVRINVGQRKEGGGAGAGAERSGAGASFQNRGQSFDGQRRGGDRPGVAGGYNQGTDNYGRPQSSPRQENPTRLYVGNLPNIEQQLETEMQNLFAGFPIKTVSRLIAPHESKAGEPGNHYYCFVDFETPEEAEQALEAYAGKESPWGGELRINKARDNRQKRQFGGPREGGYGGAREGYTRPNGDAGATERAAWR